MEQNHWVDERLAKLDPESDWQPQILRARASLDGKLTRRKSIARWTGIAAATATGLVVALTFSAPRAAAARILAPCVDACENLVTTAAPVNHIHHLIWSFHHWLHMTPPDTELTDAEGVKFRLTDYDHKVVLVNLWATWCKPCQDEIPWFTEFQQKYGDEGFAVVGISLDEDGWKSVRPAIASMKINYRVAIGDEALAKEFGGAAALPESILIDRNGFILARQVGIVSKGHYKQMIEAALDKGSRRAERN